ncbi:MAG: glycosyltransferase family 2 protein [Acidobacteria bacterium]|nr:glycosyltransferase family 2 protein [Acidobacteriota bacterium]MBV9478867.1 glycosyltransferase family 2 protein [Acidobacteriota bacterium]
MLLPTMQAWPAVAPALESLLTQGTTENFEILVIDGHGGHGSGTHASGHPPMVRWLSHPGLDTFGLRTAGLMAAKGTVVAITEDHCFVPSDWVDSIAKAHRENDAVALVGITKNHPASATSALDRANFVLTFAGQNNVRLGIDRQRLPVPTNVSFKRSALAAAGLQPGDLEYFWLHELRQSEQLDTAPGVVLEHKQRWGRATLRVHFASGCSYGASVRQWPWRPRAAWWLRLPLLPVRLFRMVGPDLFGGAGGTAAGAADVFCVLALITANVVGQLKGALFGAGASRGKL